MHQLGFEEAADLVGGEAVIAKVFDDVANFGLRLEKFARARFCGAGRGDEGAGAVT
jgi:hypothetical protein